MLLLLSDLLCWPPFFPVLMVAQGLEALIYTKHTHALEQLETLQ